MAGLQDLVRAYEGLLKAEEGGHVNTFVSDHKNRVALQMKDWLGGGIDSGSTLLLSYAL